MASLEQALALHRAGRFAEAIASYESYLGHHSQDAQGWYYAALAYQQVRNYPRADAAIGRASSLSPRSAAIHILAGNLAQDQGDLQRAKAAFDRAIECEPINASAFNNLGIVLRDAGNLTAAEGAFRRAIALKPDYARAYHNLGSVLSSDTRLEEAAACFERAISIDPNYPHPWIGLANVVRSRGDAERAGECAERATTLAPQLVESWIALANARRAARRLDEAVAAARQAVAVKPASELAARLLGEILGDAGDADEAREAFAAAKAADSSSVRAWVGHALTLPSVYVSAAAVAEVRAKFIDGLAALENELPHFLHRSVEERIRGVEWSNFFLAYQGEDDLPLQRRFAAFQRALLESALPRFFAPRVNAPVTGRRIRVGFVSRFVYTSTVGYYFKHWITDLDRDRFETIVFALSERDDPLQHEVRQAVDRFVVPADLLEAAAQSIADAKLDVLIYPELGMDARTFALASMRLAPLQCMAWGHPVTSGHANIDVAFSAAVMEPDDAHSHYGERLVKLPGIGTRYVHQGVGTLTRRREDFGLPTDRALLLFPQSLFKIHPDNDALLVQLLGREPKSTVVMFQGQSQTATQQYVSRLTQAFRSAGVDTAGRIKLLPSVPHEDYLQINQLCDIMLDSLHWSGGNTSLDALACGLPIVTWPGRFMRGRQSCGMLELMGLDGELVAHDAESYVRIARKLIGDKAYRDAMSAQIKSRSHLVLDDPAPIRALEQHLITLVEGGHGRVDRP